MFSLIWACTTLVHQLAFTFWTESWQGWVLVIAAVACVFHPDCVLRFAFLVIASLLNLWNKLPFVPNHILFEGMLHLMMLVALAGHFLRGPGRQALAKSDGVWKNRLLLLVVAAAVKALYFAIPGLPRGYLLGALTTLFLLFALGRFLFHRREIAGGAPFFHGIAPVIRLAVLAMYLWAAVQKLNHDYLDPEFSCAAVLHQDIASYFGGLVSTATWALHAAIYGSFLFEIGIPVLLYLPRTRMIGLAAAVWFHLWLAIHPAAGIFSFSSLIFAVLLFFLPRDWGLRLQSVWDRQTRWLGHVLGGGGPDRGRLAAKWLAVGGFFLTLVIQGTLYLTIARSYDVFFKANRVGCFAFFAWGIWLGACYLVAAWKGRRDSWNLPNRFRWSPVCFGLILVLANGVFPWIGGRTQTSFAMYSNLRSEGEGNHLFLRRVDWLPYQKDMVEILDSEPALLDPGERPRGIAQFANLGHRIVPWFEFRRLASEFEGDLRVRYTRGGETHVLARKGERIEGDASAFEPLPLLQRKFLWFRRLKSLDGPMVCTH